jgi:arabinofuranan 3-O-arabinosyltransferase
VVEQNFNSGWRAVLDGRVLRAVRLDGWKQAWLLPAGTRGVATLTYRPEDLYRDAVLGGLAALLLVLLVAAWPFGPRPGPPSASPDGPGTPGSPGGPGTPGSPGGPAAPGSPVASSGVPGPGVRPGSGRLRRLGQRMLLVLLTCGLAAAGLWLGGYPGAGILPAAALVFLVSTGYRGAQRPSLAGRCGLELLQPRALALLLLAASACSAVGEQLVLAARSGAAVVAVASTIPQVLCLVIVGRLAAALIIP